MPPMRRIEMSYSLSAERPERPNGPALLRNTMMDVLQAVRAHGSISAAARQLGLSYRHVWGQLKDWETQLGHELIVWERGQAAQLSPFGQRLLMAERLAHGEGCEAQPDVAADLWTQIEANGFARLPAFTLPPPGAAAPPRQLALEDALQPPPARAVCERPRVSVIDRLLSADECRLLIASARPYLKHSATIDPATGQALKIEIRTSSDTSVDPLLETSALRLVQLRMAAAAGIDLPHAERLTVLRYAPGEEYRPHRDYAPPGAIERDRPLAGNRLRTICVYLNAVEAGGATEFPVPGLRVDPVPGRAVIFDNLHPDGRPDPDSLHAGTPVEAGEKWLATLWIRQGRYRPW